MPGGRARSTSSGTYCGDVLLSRGAAMDSAQVLSVASHSAAAFPAVRAPGAGMWSTGDFAPAETQMTDSAERRQTLAT